MALKDTHRSQRTSQWPAWAAAIWAFVFALISLYWTLGDEIGLGTLAESLQEQADSPDAGFVVLMWANVLLKVLAGLTAVSLVTRAGAGIPRWMRLAGVWSAGILMTLYGVAATVEKVLILAGVLEMPSAMSATSVRWALFLWDPFWTLGGVLFLIAAWRFWKKREYIPAVVPEGD